MAEQIPDSTPMLGTGAVKNTPNARARNVRKLTEALNAVDRKAASPLWRFPAM